MNGRLTLCSMVVALVLLSWFGCPVVMALSHELSNDEAYKNPSLPPSIVAAINTPKRVYAFLRGGGGFDVNFQHEFYFTGDTKHLNTMLEALAPLSKVEGSELTAMVVPGPGRESKWHSVGEKTEFTFNWLVKIEQVILRHVVLKEHQLKDGNTSVALETKEVGTAWRVKVVVHLDGDIDLAQLRLPLAYDASVGGRVADFVGWHNNRRRAPVGGTAECDTRPTSEEKMRAQQGQGGIFESPPEFQAAQDLPTAMEQLVKFNQAQSDGISYNGRVGPYCKLKEAFLAKGSDDYFQKMLNGDNVVVRVMAMDCILEKQGAKSIPLLKSRLSSRAVLHYQLGFAGDDVATEGKYARERMIDALAPLKTTTTQDGSDDRPHLLSDQDQFALDIDILSRNDTAAMHADAAAQIAMLVDANHIHRLIPFSNQGVITFNQNVITFLAPLDLPSLRKQTGGQSDAAIIKAIGRVRPNSDVEGFLIKCLNDASLDARIRLAAGSALTRYADPNAQKALESNKDSLNKLQADAGTKIWNTLLIRQRYEEDMAPFREEKTVAGWLRLEDSIKSVMKKHDHPMVWDGFRDFIGMFKTTAAQALLRVSDRMATEIEPWNTYGGIPYLCEFALNSEDLLETEAKREGRDPSELTFKRLLSAEEYQRLVHNIEAAIGAESKAATQPTAAK